MKKQKNHWNSMLTVKLNLENDKWEVDIVGRTHPPYISTEYDGEERLLVAKVPHKEVVLPLSLLDRLEREFNTAYKAGQNLPI